LTEQVAANALALLQSKSRSGGFPRKQRDVGPGLAFTLRQAFQFVRHLEVTTLVFRREMAAQEASEFAKDGLKSGQVRRDQTPKRRIHSFEGAAAEHVPWSHEAIA
jgi:hypothetical protein